MKPWEKRRPLSQVPGYEASLKCKCGDWVVLIDYSRILSSHPKPMRWGVLHLGFSYWEMSEAKARARMKNVAKTCNQERAE